MQRRHNVFYLLAFFLTSKCRAFFSKEPNVQASDLKEHCTSSENFTKKKWVSEFPRKKTFSSIQLIPMSSKLIELMDLFPCEFRPISFFDFISCRVRCSYYSTLLWNLQCYRSYDNKTLWTVYSNLRKQLQQPDRQCSNSEV